MSQRSRHPATLKLRVGKTRVCAGFLARTTAVDLFSRQINNNEKLTRKKRKFGKSGFRKNRRSSDKITLIKLEQNYGYTFRYNVTKRMRCPNLLIRSFCLIKKRSCGWWFSCDDNHGSDSNASQRMHRTRRITAETD